MQFSSRPSLVRSVTAVLLSLVTGGKETSRAACWRAPRPGRVARACLRDLRCRERTRQGTVGPSLQLCLYETRVVNS